MRPPLTVQNAQIQTAAVEVKTLTISGKQVTLAVFRQLVEQPVIDDDGQMVGTPWGIVNYHPDKCAPGSPNSPREHRHVVWQSGDQLRRARVVKPGWWGPSVEAFWSENWADDFVQAVYCLSGHRRPDWLKAGRDPVSKERELRFHLDNIECCAVVEVDRTQYKPDHVCPTKEEHDAYLAGLRADVAGEKARRQRHLDAWAQVLALPQLFIAV